MKRMLLFVAYINDDFDAGLTYAAELARLMGKGIAMLVIDNNSFIDTFEKIMTGSTFAEANEHVTALSVLSEDNRVELDQKIESSRQICSNLEIPFSVHTSQFNMLKAIDELMGRKKGIDMVLLGPSITENGNITSSELNKLVKTASRPVVTMTRQGSEA